MIVDILFLNQSETVSNDIWRTSLGKKEMALGKTIFPHVSAQTHTLVLYEFDAYLFADVHKPM